VVHDARWMSSISVERAAAELARIADSKPARIA
jgi:hypothetical protein